MTRDRVRLHQPWISSHAAAGVGRLGRITLDEKINFQHIYGRFQAFRGPNNNLSSIGRFLIMNDSAVIFDMDGVLVDTEPYYFTGNNKLFRELGFSVPPDEYVHFVGSSAQGMWAALKERFRLSQSVDELIAMEYGTHAATIAALPSLEPIRGIVPLLTRLKALDTPLGIASSSPRSVVERTLAKSGLNSFFTIAVCGEEVENGKPHPDIFLKAARLLEVAPERCLVIEDSPRGITGAKAALMTAVGFRNPNSGNQDLSQADLVIDSFSDDEIERIIRLLQVLSLSA